MQSDSNTWIAHAQNQSNGATIKLKYKVRELGDKTEFERTLDYTLPNLAFVAINALYFKSKVEQKSEDALIRLKAAIESKVPAA